jgi:glycosyltransferase involved in cell wall biosynthesis
MRLAARLTSVIVPVSDPLRRYLVETVKVRSAAILTVENGVDAKVFSPTIERDRSEVLGEAIAGPVLGCVARFDPIKDHALLLDAFALVRRTHSRASLVLVGDGPLRAAVERRAQQSDLQGSVLFLGDRRDTPDLYRCFDVFVLASRAEGTSMSILEAMASGCCVVATDVGGNGALLDRGKAGALVAPKDSAALASKLLAILADAGQRRQLGQIARERAVSIYSQRTVALRYEALYRETLSPTASPPDAIGLTERIASTSHQSHVRHSGRDQSQTGR